MLHKHEISENFDAGHGYFIRVIENEKSTIINVYLLPEGGRKKTLVSFLRDYLRVFIDTQNKKPTLHDIEEILYTSCYISQRYPMKITVADMDIDLRD
jgi:hypothetical protein